MAFNRLRVKLTRYPFLPFHLPRAAQLAASLVVASITSYFAHELHRTNYSLPWTFILLLTSTLLTLLSPALTTTLHIHRTLSPRLNLVLNTTLSVFWTLSLALLAWWSSRTLTHTCALATWESDTGVRVCRAYKALFGFAGMGVLASWGACGVDVWVWRGGEGRGRFVRVGKSGEGAVDGAAHDGDVDGGIWDMNPNPVALRDAGRERGGHGYVLPEEQFGYVNTAYVGAAGQVGRRSVG